MGKEYNKVIMAIEEIVAKAIEESNRESNRRIEILRLEIERLNRVIEGLKEHNKVLLCDNIELTKKVEDNRLEKLNRTRIGVITLSPEEI